MGYGAVCRALRYVRLCRRYKDSDLDPDPDNKTLHEIRRRNTLKMYHILRNMVLDGFWSNAVAVLLRCRAY